MSFTALWRQHDFAAVAARIAGRGPADVRRALDRARRGLSLEDFGALLSPAAVPFLEEMAQLSHELTVERFGRTMQLYAPLYLSNVCANVCTYCGFSAQNRIARKVLTEEEIIREAEALRLLGFDHVLLVTGESGRVGSAYLARALRLLRPFFSSLAIEVQPLAEAEYSALAADGLSAVLVYQETYDPAVYPRHHLRGPKADLEFRLETPGSPGPGGPEEDRPGRPLRPQRLAGRRLVRRPAPAPPRAAVLADPL